MTFPTGHDNNQINVLQAAMKLACKELCISKTDQESRERVASWSATAVGSSSESFPAATAKFAR
jgi:hypothetical protein